MDYFLGIDFGTSGARAIVINHQKNIIDTQHISWTKIPSEKLAQVWHDSLFDLILQIPLAIRSNIKAIAVNGTSSTVLLCDAQGKPITEPILYNDSRGQTVLPEIKNIAPVNHVVLSASSSLTKLLWWQKQPYFTQARYFLHQADWLGFLLHDKLGISDYHNALKLGYDVNYLRYPRWLLNLPINQLLPQVVNPGALIGKLTKENCQKLNLSPDCIVKAGTTDSIAAFLASDANQPGDAVTSLGSTLVLKLLSRNQVNAAEYGIYSHRLGDLWLTGGASNTGGAVLKHFFTLEQLEKLSVQIDPKLPSPFQYYPLLQPGDRFPINDSNLPAQLEPRPAKAEDFLYGLLEGISRIEHQGYRKLELLGADTLKCVYSAGGGAKNATWTKIRHRYLKVPVKTSQQTDAAYGTALLAADKILLTF
ncbi:MAG: FGGY-family carbohydrate kinase [Cyanobacteria bacterium J06621_8]